jgi:hypothetical protein
MYADLGDKDQAFRWLNTAYQERDLYLLKLNTDFLLDPIRSDPRVCRAGAEGRAATVAKAIRPSLTLWAELDISILKQRSCNKVEAIARNVLQAVATR